VLLSGQLTPVSPEKSRCAIAHAVFQVIDARTSASFPTSHNNAVQRHGGPEETMQGLMMDMPLLISGLIQYAADYHGEAEIVAREIEGDIHLSR
jgi:hypothetical protein